jgi:hypothetical protein
MLKGPLFTALCGAGVGVGGQGFVDQRCVVFGVGVAAVAALLGLLHVLGVVALKNDGASIDESMATDEMDFTLSAVSLPAGCPEVRAAIIACLECREGSPKRLDEIRYYQEHICEIETAPQFTAEALAALIREGRVGRVKKAGKDHGKFRLLRG